MSRNSPRQYANRSDITLATECLHHAEVRLKGEETNGLIAERGLIQALLRSATRHLASVTRTLDVAALETRIAEAHRLRAALDVRLSRKDFRVVKGGLS